MNPIMKPRRFFSAIRFAAGCCLLVALSACSLLHRHPKDAAATPASTKSKAHHTVNGSGLVLEVKASPDPLKLGETREISVNIIVRNLAGNSTTLKFPTTQILEIALRDVATDTVVSKWSTDRSFSDDRRIIPINKGEHLEYTEPITTRELKVGTPYNLEVYFLGLREGVVRQEGDHSATLIPSAMALFSDYHMHPQGHRVQPYDQALLQPWADAARERGLRDIALTDHDRYHEGVDFEAIEQLRANNPDLHIRAGIELDNDPVTGESGRRWVEANWDRLDFVLGSVHYLSAAQMFDSAGQEGQFAGRDIDEIYADYFSRVRAVAASGLIDCLAHLDLIKIHRFRARARMADLIGETLAFIKQRDLAIEISTAGWRKPVGEQYPSVEIIRLAKEVGIPFTVASDAHSRVQQAENYDRLAGILAECGINEVCVYEHHERRTVAV